MKLGVIAAALIGLAVAIWLVVHIGVGSVLGTIEKVGWGGFIFLCLYTLVLPVMLGSAWFSLVPGEPLSHLPSFAIARQVRDSASDVLPFSQLGGIVIGVRAAVLRGLAAPIAFASSIADITTELMAQLVFVALGTAFCFTQLQKTATTAPFVNALVIGLALMVPGIAVFIFLQQRGSTFAMTLAQRLLPNAVNSAAAFSLSVKTIYGSRGRLAASSALHLLGWTASGVTTFIAIRLIGGKIDILSAIAIESLLGGLRSVTAFVPASIGVQEAGYAALTPLFGLGPEVGLAVSLIKRARDIVIGVPVLLLWQAMEGRRAFSGQIPET
jgi:putative membrane protein